MDDDFQAFKGTANGNRDDVAEPPDGNHTAELVNCKLGTSRAGDRLIICEWQTADFQYFWTTFHRVEGNARPFTRRLLDRLGVDFDGLETWDALADALDQLGGAWMINVTRNGTFLNIEVLEGRTQTELPVNAPAQPASDFDDDDIPF